MRPRILRKVDADGARLPASPQLLRSVDAPGQPIDSPELWLGVHIAALQGEATLEKLATRAQRFTPRVSLVAPDGLLLEVKGSLHLFNGTDGLIRAFNQDCNTIGVECSAALAPTPLAALVAARVGQPFVVTNEARLVGKLAPVPLAPLRWPDDVVERLARMGVRTIGQLLRLPRAGFARRFGPARLSELDGLIGRSADLRHRFQPRERFRRRRELTYEMENTATILAALAPLLADLGKFLDARQCGVTEVECRLRHRHAPPSRCVVRLSAPLADVARLTELLGERLHALVLPEPVRSCELRSGLPVLRVLSCDSLWQPGEYGGAAGPESPQLVERLRARLGDEAVYGLRLLPGHRPESVWSRSESGLGGAIASQSPKLVSPWAAFRRPLWLLREPQQLEEIEGVPHRYGSLRFFGDVERIETGWWDGGEIGRDYYTVFDIYGVQLWIFRERAALHRWFLHGVFG
jgi:protein ImuB